MKKFLRISLAFLLVSICFLGSINANAKSVSISKTSIVNYQYPGLVYGSATSINEYGMIIYNDDQIESQYKILISNAADSWNKAIGRRVFASYHDINAPVDMVDMNIVKNSNGSYFDGGGAGYGYGHSQTVLNIGEGWFTERNIDPNTVDYLKAISNIRHEMGHALGLAHDYGLVMADLGAGQINNDQEMINAGLEINKLLDRGILPAIPNQNKYGVLNILNNMSTIYYIPGTESNKIARQYFDSNSGTISGIRFETFQATIVKNYNLCNFDNQPDNYFGTTLSNNLIGETMTVTEIITNRYNNDFYLFKWGEHRFVVSSKAFNIL